MKRTILALLVAVSAAISMPQQTGRITGRILHSDGTAAIGMRVVAARIGTSEVIEPIFIGPTNTRTDAAGMFRFESLPAGDYYVATGAEYFSQAVPRAGLYGFMFRDAYYFPGVREQTRATMVPVGSGTTRDAEFRLASPPVTQGPSFKVSGSVQGNLANWIAANKRNPQGYFRVTLNAPQDVGCGGPDARFVGAVAPDGAFELRNVPPGTYVACLAFFGGDAGNRVSAAGLNVAANDITDLNFDLDRRAPGQPAPPAR